MARNTVKTILSIGPDWRIDTDGEMNFTLMERQEVDKTHHLAKADGETHRWVVRGYYGVLDACLRAMRDKMILSSSKDSDGTIEYLLSIIVDANLAVDAAVKTIHEIRKPRDYGKPSKNKEAVPT